METHKCTMCFYSTNSYAKFCSHIVRRHKHDPHFIVHCTIGDCMYSTRSWTAFRQHTSRKHRQCSKNAMVDVQEVKGQALMLLHAGRRSMATSISSFTLSHCTRSTSISAADGKPTELILPVSSVASPVVSSPQEKPVLSTAEAPISKAGKTPPLASESPQAKIRLPIYSHGLKLALQRGGLTGREWRQMVAESAAFYQATLWNLDSKTVYGKIGELLHANYPCIAREGSKPWRVFIKTMSSKMRMDRYNNRLTKLKSQREGHNLDKLPRKDKAAVPSHSATLSDCGPGIQSEEDYQASVRELQLQHNKPAKEQDMAHIRVLLRETFQRRRSWIQGLEGGCIKEILKIYPLFQYGKFLMEEFQIILERSQKTLDAVGDRLRHFLETISEIMPLKDLRQNDHRIPSILQYAETQTAIRKGWGQKSMPAVEVWNDISEEDLLKQKPCKESAPMLVILLKGNVFEYAVLLCDGQVLYTQACDSAQALLVLMASYYVFELDYPRAFSQFLGLLQQKVVGDPYTGHRGLRLQHFLAKL